MPDRIDMIRGCLTACLLLTAATSACGNATPTPVSPSSTELSSAAAEPSAVSEELAEAIAFRKRYGLRADEAWVRTVATDPAAQAAINEYGVPLTPAEFEDLQSRRFDLDLFDDVQAYGRLFPEDYAGTYLDQATTGIIVSFKNRVERHQTAIANLFGETAKIQVRDVEWSNLDLDEFTKRVTDERAWFETIGIRFISADRAIMDNFVSVHYLGPAEAVGPIEAHFGNPPWLKAESSGELPWTGARGDLVLVVSDKNGKPLRDVWCDFEPENPRADEGGEMIFGTGADGQCEIRNLPAVGYRITLHELVDNDHYEPIMELRVAVAPGRRNVFPVVVPS